MAGTSLAADGPPAAEYASALTTATDSLAFSKISTLILAFPEVIVRIDTAARSTP